MSFVKNPNLPCSARTIIIGERYYEQIKPLEKEGLDLLLVPDNPCVDARLSGHADLSVLHMGKNKIALAKYLQGSDFSEKLKGMGAELYFAKGEQREKYPDDAVLNMCLCGQNLICNLKTADGMIVDLLTNENGLKLIGVKQGYSKCSICVVNERAIITSDAGVHKRAVEAGLDSLKIEPGYVDLPGFDYGFIGGASFKISKNLLAFTGTLDGHPDKDSILKFLSLHNTKAVYITQNRLFDIGSGIQIVEKDRCVT